MFACPATDDFFRSRIDHMIDLRHPLAVLSSRMPWQQIEASVAHLFVRKARAGVAMPDLDLFGEAPEPQARKSNAGRPRVALRIMIALLYLKHAFNESDEGVVERWGETPTWQFFSGQAYFEHRRPCDASTLVKFRQLLGDEGVEELLAQTVNVAVALKLIQPQELEQVLVDSTVQHKAIAHPTDSKLLETARVKLVEVAKQAGIELKQTYAKEGQALGRKAGRYAHAKQWRRMKHTIKRQRTVVGRLQREAEVSCINKGKSRQPYEFGVKVGIASTAQHNLIVGAKAFHGNPYDGHTLVPQLEQAAILMQDTGSKPSTAVVDLGYRGVDADNPNVRIVHRGKSKRLTQAERELLKRRQAIEPIIGHLKADHRMGRCHLKGELGDRLHAVLCAAGYNIKWLLRMIAQKGVAFLGRLFLCLRWGSVFAALKRLWGQRCADGLQSGGSWVLADRLEMAGAGK
jgi:IS5 family transposase